MKLLYIIIKFKKLLPECKLFNPRIVPFLILLIPFFLSNNSRLYSQTASPSLPMLTAPSPEASMLNKYGNYPVSLYTGLVDITIPIFEIKINGVDVPIEFKYHASGLKYDDIPMELGYGWTLIAGGTISHSVRGTPEGRSISNQPQRGSPYVFIKAAEDISKYQNTRSGTVENDQNDLIDLNNGVIYPFNSINGSNHYKDGEYDEYDYNFANHIGQTYSLDGNLIRVPANGMRIDAYFNSSVPLIDNDGISYFFTQMDQDEYGLNEVAYLTKIVSANKADTVIFDYTKYYHTGTGYHADRPVINQSFTVTETVDGIHSDYPGFRDNQFKGYGGGIDYKSFYPPRLNFIQYRGGKIEFIYTNQTDSHSLSEIKIYNSLQNLIRSVKLKKPRTDWLDGIDFTDSTGNVTQNYSFEYDGVQQKSGGIDYWGYYNGSSIGNGAGYYIPNFNIRYVENSGSIHYYTIQGMDRNPNEDVMQGGILKKITYPSKGYTRFFYEAHKADNKIYGGLRIKEIQNYDANDVLVEKKWYKYGVNESGQGRPASYIMPPDTSNPNFAEDFCERSLVVTDGEDSVKAAYIEKETYIRTYYPFPKMSYFTSGSSVVYPEVTEYSGTGTTPNGKTVYKYTDFPEEKRPTNRGYSVRQLYKSYPWKNGQLLSKTVYDNTGKIVYSLNNNYSYLADSAYLNLSVRQYADIISTYPLGNPNGPANLIKNSLGDVDFNPFVPFIDAVGGTLFDYYNYYITTGIPIITSSSEYMDGLTKTTTYSNYNSIGLPGEMQILDSKGAGYTTKYKYHYTTISETQRYKASTILSQTINEYQDWGNGMIEPGIIKFQPTTISPLESRIVYHNRDKYGNAQFISKDGTENIVYIWSYNGQYPIAEIKNATYDNVLNAIGGQWEIDHIADEAEPSTDDFDLINGLRSNSALKSAIISTYTYLPGVGMTSSTDSRGNMIYYRYDSFGRLVIVFDKNKQVIKHYCYNYAGQQTENCEVTSFKNVAASKTYKRNNCTAGYEGADVLYSVPAGKYISYVSQKDADQQAQNDIEFNGQEYANQQGACLAKINYTFNIKNYISVNAPGANNNTNFNITIVGGDAAGVHMVQGNGGTTTVQAGTFPNNNATIIINFYPYSGSPAAHYVTMSGPFGTKTASTESNNTATFSGLNLTTLGTINVSFN